MPGYDSTKDRLRDKRIMPFRRRKIKHDKDVESFLIKMHTPRALSHADRMLAFAEYYVIFLYVSLSPYHLTQHQQQVMVSTAGE